ncbi:hypothetical protein [Streptomyces sp. TLI_171]|uniref:hypothetical protein n=1 Tax=Streptomyces sp. TLI_171 TaxID=1938859 RepID=UPI000C173F3D|nr:hypothetical protein [Streptomyces sp. TLI_171]RKE02931.1 hypothetical protein BX266_7534 [Streptomyces sp. TLI_171]
MNQSHQPEPTTGSDERRPSTLREAAARWLNHLTAPGGRLDKVRRDLVAAVEDWDDAERWVRVLAYLIAFATAALVLGTAGGILLQAAAAVVGAVHLPDHIPGDGLAATITNPVHSYLAAHLPEPLDTATAYGLWKTFGLATAVVAAVSQAATWRAAWVCWSAATLAMVWIATPEPGRTVAAGITAAALTAASALALRGLSFSLRPLVVSRTEVHPQIVVQAPETLSPIGPGSPIDHRS